MDNKFFDFEKAKDKPLRWSNYNARTRKTMYTTIR